MAARRAAVEGRVLVTFRVDKRGTATKARVVDGLGHGCDKAVLDWVRATRFHPAKDIHGRTQPVWWVTLPVRFELE